jgi:hypothetical protein
MPLPITCRCCRSKACVRSVPCTTRPRVLRSRSNILDLRASEINPSHQNLGGTLGSMNNYLPFYFLLPISPLPQVKGSEMKMKSVGRWRSLPSSPPQWPPRRRRSFFPSCFLPVAFSPIYSDVFHSLVLRSLPGCSSSFRYESLVLSKPVTTTRGQTEIWSKC